MKQVRSVIILAADDCADEAGELRLLLDVRLAAHWRTRVWLNPQLNDRCWSWEASMLIVCRHAPATLDAWVQALPEVPLVNVQPNTDAGILLDRLRGLLIRRRGPKPQRGNQCRQLA